MVFRCDELLLSYNRFQETKDQWDQVAVHTQKGIGYLETYSQFIRSRCQVETEYARNLRRLVKSYLPKKKDKDDDDLQFTFCKAFRDAVNETGDLAGQHEIIAEDLMTCIVQEVHNLIKEFKEERKKHLNEGARLQQHLQLSLQQLEKAKKNYEKSFREAEKAQENYQKADADLNLSRAEVEKTRLNAAIKNQQCEDSKNEYANQLQKTNQLQYSHYHTSMPSIFQALQEMDEKRISSFKALLKKSVEIERKVFPIINKCLDGIVSAADSIQEKADSQVVVERYKSGFTPPGDIPFDDLSTPRQNGESTPHIVPPARQDTIKGTISASKLKKRVGLFGIFGKNTEDFSDLPPNQRKKKIQHKIDEVIAKLHQESSAKDGLLKMKEVYEGNPALGDPMTITGQLSDAVQSIERLKSELERYQAMLEEAERETSGLNSVAPNTPTSSSIGRHSNTSKGGTLNGGGASPRTSLMSQHTSHSDESLSRSSHSPESGIGLSHNSLHGSETYDQPDRGDCDEEFYEVEPLPIIGNCRALYNFDGASEGSMSVVEGEVLHVIELDQGDGWTRVRRKSIFEEGFVPTSYITITLDNNC